MKPPSKTLEPDDVSRRERMSQLRAEAVETAAGAAAGAAFGVLAGPAGAVAGAAFGAVVAAVLGHQAHGEEHEKSVHFEELEDEAESIREWRGSHPPPPPQAADPPEESVAGEGAMALDDLEDSLRGG